MALKDITQTIKINALTKNAQKNIQAVGTLLNKLPPTNENVTKLMQGHYASLNNAMSTVKSSAVALAATFTAAAAGLRTGFKGLILDTQVLNNLKSSILALDVALDANSLWLYADSLLKTFGVAAPESARAITTLINAGFNNLQQIKSLTNAMIAYSRLGYSMDQLAKILAGGNNDMAKGFKQVGIYIKDADDALALFTRRGEIKFEAIDTGAIDIQLNVLSLKFDEMLQGFALKVAPMITPVIQFIIDNMLAIKNIIVTGIVAIGIKQAVAFTKSLLLLTGMVTTELGKQLKQKLALLQAEEAKLNVTLATLAGLELLLANLNAQYIALEANQTAQIAINQALNKSNSIVGLIFNKTNLMIGVVVGIVAAWNAITNRQSKVNDQAQLLINSQEENLQQQIRINSLLKSAANIQTLLGKKTKLNKQLQDSLARSYDILIRQYPALTANARNHKIEQQDLIGVTRNLNDVLIQLYNSRLEIQKSQVHLNRLKLMNTDLPGTQYSRMLQRLEARNEFALNPAVVHAFDNYEKNLLGSKFAEACDNLRVMAEHTSDRNLQLYYLTLAEQLHGQMVALASLNLMPLLPPIPRIAPPAGGNSPATTPNPKSFSMGTLLEEYDTDVQKLERLFGNVAQLKGDFESSMLVIKNARNSLYFDYNLDDQDLKSLITEIVNLTNVYNALVNTLNLAIISYNELTDEQKLAATDRLAEIENLKKLVNAQGLSVDNLKKLKDRKDALIKVNETIQSEYLGYLQLQERIARQNVELATSEEDKKIAQEVVTASIQKQILAYLQILPLLESTSIAYAMIVEKINELKQKLLDKPLESKFDWINQLQDIVSPITSAFDSLGNAIGNVLVKGANFGKLMKDVWTNMTASILANLSAMIAKMGIMLLLQALIPKLGSGTLGGLFGFGGLVNGTTIWSQLFPKDLPKSNSKSRITSNSIIPNMNNALSIKLDRIGNLLLNFTPINTQVIDLPTLAKANSIGNAMLVGSI